MNRKFYICLTVCTVLLVTCIFPASAAGQKDRYSFKKGMDGFHEGLAIVYDTGNKLCGAINKQGEWVFGCMYNITTVYSEGLAAFKADNGLYGYLDKQGAVAIEPVWRQAGIFSQGRAEVVNANGNHGFIDAKGELVIPCLYTEAYCFTEGLAAVRWGETWGFIDRDGNIVIDFVWKQVRPFSEGLAAVCLPMEIGVSTLIRKYLGVELDAGVQLPGKWGYIDRSGNVVIDCEWNHALPFSEGLAPVEKAGLILTVGGSWGFIDRTGSVVMPYAYKESGLANVIEQYWISESFSDMHGLFSNGLARVKNMDFVTSLLQGGNYGYINSHGDEVLPCVWKDAGAFTDSGVARVQSDAGWGYMRRDGSMLALCEWDEAAPFLEGFGVTTLDGMIYVIDSEGGRSAISPFGQPR